MQSQSSFSCSGVLALVWKMNPSLTRGLLFWFCVPCPDARSFVHCSGFTLRSRNIESSHCICLWDFSLEALYSQCIWLNVSMNQRIFKQGGAEHLGRDTMFTSLHLIILKSRCNQYLIHNQSTRLRLCCLDFSIHICVCLWRLCVCLSVCVCFCVCVCVCVC